MDYIFIDNSNALNDFCAQSTTVLALDTEFVRNSTFFPKPGLFQANNGQTIALIDPLSIDNWRAFIALLADPAVVKVLHACDEDIELFFYFLQCKPVNVFDTQVAAALCGLGYSLSYQSLLELLLSVSIEKEQRRSDWLLRPLSEQQKQYAANDVRYLPALYENLKQQLEAQNKSGFLLQEYQESTAELGSEDYSQSVSKIKNTWRMSTKQYQRLAQLAAWREQLMRRLDLPRKRIATDDALKELAQCKKVDKHRLFAIQGFAANVLRQEQDRLLQLCATQSSVNLPVRMKKGSLYQTVRERLAALAGEQKINVELLEKKSLLVQLCYFLQEGLALPEAAFGWRQSFYQQVFDQLSSESS